MLATGLAGGALFALPLGSALLVAAAVAAVHAWSLAATVERFAAA